MVTERQIHEVLKEYPDLNYFGFGLYSQRDNIKRNKELLFRNIKEIAFVVELLQKIGKTKTFNKRYTSYGLRHWAEKTAEDHYISNGSFIVGAILAGFKVKKIRPNAYFNMSGKSLKQQGLPFI